MQLAVDRCGTIRCLYGEALDLTAFGPPAIARASHVEPGPDGRWSADMRPLQGPVLGHFSLRSAALEAEQAWLESHWLFPRPGLGPAGRT
jgi:hypothetical protein